MTLSIYEENRCHTYCLAESAQVVGTNPGRWIVTHDIATCAQASSRCSLCGCPAILCRAPRDHRSSGASFNNSRKLNNWISAGRQVRHKGPIEQITQIQSRADHMSLRNWSCRNTGTIRTVPILPAEDFANANFRAKIKLAGFPRWGLLLLS